MSRSHDDPITFARWLEAVCGFPVACLGRCSSTSSTRTSVKERQRSLKSSLLGLLLCVSRGSRPASSQKLVPHIALLAAIRASHCMTVKDRPKREHTLG